MFCCVCVCLCICTHEGKKQDVWFVVDPETGEKQTSLTTSSSESICPNTPLLYIGRTGMVYTQTHTHTPAHTGIFMHLGLLSINFAPACYRIHGYHV